MHVIQFADENIKLTKRESLGFGLNINGDVLTLMFARHYSIRLWSEVKKSARHFSLRSLRSGKPSRTRIARLCLAPMTKSRRFPGCFRLSAS